MLWPEPPLLPPAEDFDNLLREQCRSAICYFTDLSILAGEFLGELTDPSVLPRHRRCRLDFWALLPEVDVVESWLVATRPPIAWLFSLLNPVVLWRKVLLSSLLDPLILRKKVLLPTAAQEKMLLVNLSYWTQFHSLLGHSLPLQRRKKVLVTFHSRMGSRCYTSSQD